MVTDGRSRSSFAPRSELAEIELIAGDAEVFDDVSNNATRYIAGMPCKRDEPVGLERIGIVPVAARCTEQFATDFPQATLQLPAVVGRIFTHDSGGEDEFVAESRRNGAAGFQQCFQMDFRGLLKAEQRLAPVASVCMTAGQEVGLGNPHAVFILPELYFGEWNNHCVKTLSQPTAVVK